MGFDKPKVCGARYVSCRGCGIRQWRFRRDAYLPSILAAATMAFGCTASVNRFAVVPSHVCAGTPVKLEMDVLGSPTITVDPPLEQQAGETYVPETTTHFVLSVRRWPLGSRAGSETEVKVMPGTPAQVDEIAAAVICQDQKITGSLLRPQGEWDPRLRVTTVESGEDRDIVITHEGREGRVTPQNPTTTAFDGTSPGGAWTFSSPLGNGERCDGSRAPLNLLNVSAQVTCGN